MGGDEYDKLICVMNVLDLFKQIKYSILIA